VKLRKLERNVDDGESNTQGKEGDIILAEGNKTFRIRGESIKDKNKILKQQERRNRQRNRK
jgi:hypothetical protein